MYLWENGAIYFRELLFHMEDRKNKPRVFLSHSWKDKQFIEQLAEDLKKCHIHPWLDSDEIRDGKPWLKVIFEDGIPTCDAVLVYFTEHSLESKIVGKEVDAALIEQLAGSGIAFLPYVNKAELRDKLRLDIRALKCREWNQGNYHLILPSIVAEIWHSYLERRLTTAVLQEKNKRLELEIELKKLEEKYQANIFSSSEEKDFQYIYNKLNRSIEIEFDLWEKSDSGDKIIGKDVFQFTLIDLIIFYLNKGYDQFEKPVLIYDINHEVLKGYPSPVSNSQRHYGNRYIEGDPFLGLQTYGLLKTFRTENTFLNRTENKLDFTDKMYRFHYWVGYNNKISDDLPVKFIEHKRLEENIK